jgi:hypothetical protein
MQSKQFPTFDDAVAHMEKAGEVKFFGREEDIYIYTLTIGNTIYQIMLNKNGFLKVFNERYV